MDSNSQPHNRVWRPRIGPIMPTAPSIPLAMDTRQLSLGQQEAMARMRQVVQQDNPNTNVTQSLDAHVQQLRTLLD